jgi:hypothetical protein
VEAKRAQRSGSRESKNVQGERLILWRENYCPCCVTWASELKIVAAVKEDQLPRKSLDHRSTENSHSSRSPWTNTKRRRLQAAKHERKIAARARDPGWQDSVHTNSGIVDRDTGARSCTKSSVSTILAAMKITSGLNRCCGREHKGKT